MQSRNGKQMADACRRECSAHSGRKFVGFGGQHSDHKGGVLAFSQGLQPLYGLPAQPQQPTQRRKAVPCRLYGKLPRGQRHPAGKQQSVSFTFNTGNEHRSGDPLSRQRRFLLRQIGGQFYHTVRPADTGKNGAAMGGVGADRQHRPRKGHFTAGHFLRSSKATGINAAYHRRRQQTAQQRPPQRPQRFYQAKGKAKSQQDCQCRTAQP